MTPPVFFTVAAFGLAAPLMAQTPVHSMPGEAGRPFACLTIFEEEPAGFGALEAEEAVRADRNVLVFSDINLLSPAERFCPVRIELIEGLEAVPLDLGRPADPVPADSQAPDAGGVVMVGRKTLASSAATPVPEPSCVCLSAIAAAGMVRRRRRA